MVKPSRRPQALKIFSESKFDQIPQLRALPQEQRFAMNVVSRVLPFRVNQYVLDELIDWSRVPEDPVFQITFPQKRMLNDAHFDRIASLLVRDASSVDVNAAVTEIRAQLNPHPAGQLQRNVPQLDGVPLPGMQHKYRETVLFFPAQGQTCHSYCTFCFRWAQFIGNKSLKFASGNVDQLTTYLAQQRAVTDVLITGGDPMVMGARHVARYIDALLQPELEHVQNIRIGSKSLTFWPQRYVTDRDADDLLRVFDRAIRAGKHVTFMAHVDHWRELESDICQRAIRRIRDTGVVIRSQAPLLRHVNDDADVWSTMWRKQVKLGIVPYYMFVERDTGARQAFDVPLARCYEIYRDAIQRVSGLARTVRGPSMSTDPGKIEIQGVTEIGGEKVFVLRFLQARDPALVQQPFFAKYDEHATWLNHLVPAFGHDRFPFER
jgi:KamA family protein